MRKTQTLKMKRKELFRNRIPIYQKDIVLFAKEVCSFSPDEWQEKVMIDLANSNKVSVRSGQGVGKTCLQAIVLLWFLTCFRFPKVIATAPTRQQLNDVLWSEVEKWRSKSPLLRMLVTWTKTYVYMRGYEKRWFAVAKTASEPENIQGFHEDNMLIIVDEASGVSDPIMEALLATLSGANNKLLMCANPTRTTGTFYDSHNKDRALYKCHKVSSLDSKRTNKENIAAFIRKYGADSNVVKVRIYGDFPEQEDDVYIPLTLVEQTINNEFADLKNVNKISFGVDVARYGDDETIIGVKAGPLFSLPIIRHGQDLMRTVGDIVMQYKQTIKDYHDYKGPITINIDDTGVGGGVTDRLEEIKQEQNLTRMIIVPVNFASKVPQDGADNYKNLTSYMWSNIRELMRAKDLSIPNDEDLIAQLSVRKYTVASDGKILLETKDQMKERGIKSPDRADALALACFDQKKIYSSFIDSVSAEKAVIIPIDAARSIKMEHISIGIGMSNPSDDISIVATGIAAGYSRAIVLCARKFKNTGNDTLSKDYVGLVSYVSALYGRIDYVYVDKKEKFLYRNIREASEKYSLGLNVRMAADDDVNNRIRLTTHLITKNRLFLTNECDVLTSAFESAVWADKRSSNPRSDTSDVGTLSAFEYTIERESKRFIQS